MKHDNCTHGLPKGFCPVCAARAGYSAARIDSENSEMSTAHQTIAHMHREREELIERVKRLRKQFTGASRSVAAERAEKKKVQARVSALQAEIERLRAELIEARRIATRLLDDHGRACVRAEQAEDRAEKAERERDALRFTQTSGAYAVCATHPHIFSPNKWMPCPTCVRDTAIAAKERAEGFLREIAGYSCDEVRMPGTLPNVHPSWCRSCAARELLGYSNNDD